MHQFTIFLFNTEGRSPAGHFLESRLSRPNLEAAEKDALELCTLRHNREPAIIGFRIFTDGVKVAERTVF